MDLHEHQAKQLLKKHNIPVSNGLWTTVKEEISHIISKLNHSNGLVVKAQIHAGGRGKAGGVKLAKTPEEASSIAHEMMGKTLVTHQTGPKGKKVRRIYIEEASDIKKEFYLSLVLDRSTGDITIIASSEGGVDIEEVADKNPEKIKKCRVHSSSGISPCHARKLGFAMGMTPDLIKKFVPVVMSTHAAFLSLDCAQLEINPLILKTDDTFLALDAKVSIDDNSLFKHKEIAEMRDLSEEDEKEVEASKYGLNYIRLDGQIGCMVNGAGLAMATMDIIKHYGSDPANFLDVGGSAEVEAITEAFKIIVSDPNVKGILVNIFGGIMRCDKIAEGILQAIKQVKLHIPLVVRLSGTNRDKGMKMLQDSGLNVDTADSLDEAAQKIVNKVKKVQG